MAKHATVHFQTSYNEHLESQRTIWQSIRKSTPCQRLKANYIMINGDDDDDGDDDERIG